MKNTFSPHVKQICLFLFVGGVTFLIDLCVTVYCNKVLMLPPYLSATFGFLSGFAFNFPMNKKQVFKHNAEDRLTGRMQLIMYVLLCLFNLFMTSLLTQALTVGLRVDIAVSKTLVTIVISIWNFVIYKYLIFSKREKVLIDE